MHLDQVLAVDVGVDLSGGDIHVTQHRLNGSKVGPVLQQVGCKGVAQHMRGEPGRDPSGQAVLAEELPYGGQDGQAVFAQIVA